MKTLLAASICIAAVALAFANPAVGQAPGAAAAHSPNDTITIDNFSFNAQTITVPAGTAVTWINRDDVPHKVVSTDKKFSSPVLDTDGRFSYTFAAAGTYEYYCSIHPTMVGKVIVK
jgi:amicyanin